MLKSIFSAIAIAAFCSTASDAARPTMYPSFLSPGWQLTTFDVSGAVYTLATGIDDAGRVAGYYQSKDAIVFPFVRIPNGKIVKVNLSGGAAFAIKRNVVIGTYNDSGSLTDHGFLHSASGTITKFDAPGAGTLNDIVGTLPISINNAGVMSGYLIDNNHIAKGFVRTPDGTITEFVAPGAGKNRAGDGTFARAINAHGVVVGYLKNSHLHGFVRTSDGTITIVNVPDTHKGTSTLIYGVNDSGVIVGQYLPAVSQSMHGFIRSADGTTFTNFYVKGSGAAPGGTFPTSINNSGVVAGYFTDSNQAHHGFVRATDGKVTKIDAPGAGTTAGHGTYVTGINDNGAASGSYIDDFGKSHAFVAIP